MLKRDITPQILKVSKQRPIISITGPRQSGKTTLCQQIFPNYFYANLENPETWAFALEDPKRFLLKSSHTFNTSFFKNLD